MNRAALSRLDGERRAKFTLIRLLCAVSVWRTIMTRILSLCASSAWWTALLCLLPGFAVASILRLTMRLTQAATIPEALRVCLGKVSVVLLSAVLTALLLVDGVSSLTALITVFTQGVGTRGTQFTLAVLTGVVLLFSLHREGLPRAAYLLRWVVAASAVLLAVFALGDAKADRLFPLYGEGRAAVAAALKAGWSLSWPVVLLLTVEPPKGKGRLRSAVVPVFCSVGAVLLTTLTIPHELLIRQDGLASLLLLPTRYAPNSLRVVALCLLMLVFFLSIGASAQLATTQLLLPWKEVPAWLPHGLLAAIFLTQTADVSRLWAWLGVLEPWLLAPLALLAVLALPFAFIRRNKP